MTNSIMNAAAGMILLVTGFLSALVIARVLGPEANGTIAYVLWLVTTGSLIAELGTGITLLRILPQLKVRGFEAARRRGFAASLLRPVMLSTVTLLIVSVAFYHTTGVSYLNSPPQIILIIAILFFIQSIGSFSKNYFTGEQNFVAYSRLTSAASVVQLLGVTIGALFAGLPGALIGYIAAQLIPFAVAVKISLTPRDNCGIDRRYLISSSSVLVVEFVVSAVFLTRPELFFLQHFQGVEAVGFYAVALSLSNLALQLPIQLTGSLLPFYAEKREQGDGTMPQPVFEGVVRNLSYITLPMCFGLAAISGSLVTSLYGEAFRSSGPIVAALSLGAPIFVFLQVCTQYLLSMEGARARLVIAVIGSVVMVMGSVIVIPVWGGLGAAIIRNCVFAIMVICTVRMLRFQHALVPMYAVVARVALSSAASGGAAWIVSDHIGGASGIIFAVIAGGLVYLAALRILRVVPDEDALVMQNLISKLPAPARAIFHRILGLIVRR